MISNELDQAWIVQSERVVAPFDLVPDYASSTSDHLPVKARFLLECTLLPDEISSENSSFCIGETVILTVPESAARIQWQRLDADNNWQNIPEATEATFSFTFEENASYRVRFADASCEVFSAPIQVQAAEDCEFIIEEQVFGNPPLRIAPRLEEGQRFVLLSLDEGITAVNPENPEELLLLGAGQALAEIQIFEGERLLRTLPISFRIAPATLSIIVEEGQFKFEGEADPVFTFFAEGLSLQILRPS
ncbi:hypothetical protein A3SI_02491 [Nitritalea halalkaliphila LW7]|uniref:Uncharacterized protein n=1 Tax=Nitritalea halalkaliphila LW7 TaxID=1189621 RepID=I5C9T6_9BACT|nr:hypothetical protein [Nitritalea halalkaliphila]EIM78588.1 hypothetical protein A3SI_02491 [Nitritalea halalkaliphila LW7]